MGDLMSDKEDGPMSLVVQALTVFSMFEPRCPICRTETRWLHMEDADALPGGNAVCAEVTYDCDCHLSATVNGGVSVEDACPMAQQMVLDLRKELEEARKEREQLTEYALKELDPEIDECEVSLSALKAAMNNTERRRDLERRLFNLKRERRHECHKSWKDLVYLKQAIGKLKKEIDSISGTANTAKNRKAPM